MRSFVTIQSGLKKNAAESNFSDVLIRILELQKFFINKSNESAMTHQFLVLGFNDSTTILIMTLHIMTLHIMPLLIMTLLIMTLVMILLMMALLIITLIIMASLTIITYNRNSFIIQATGFRTAFDTYVRDVIIEDRVLVRIDSKRGSFNCGPSTLRTVTVTSWELVNPFKVNPFQVGLVNPFMALTD
jgi:hypothetical protein